MRCNRRKKDEDCPCCNRAADKLEKALELMLKLSHRLAQFDPASVPMWKTTLGDPSTWRMAVKILGRDNVPNLDDVLPNQSDQVEE